MVVVAPRSRPHAALGRKVKGALGGVGAVLLFVWAVSRSSTNPASSRCVTEIDGAPFKWHQEKVCVTETVFMDMAVGDQPLGRLQIGLFGDVVPKSTANFRKLCTCEMARASQDFKHMCYHNDSFHRLIPNFVMQGGSHATGRSMFGKTFIEQFSDEKHTFLSHAKRGVLAWAEYPIGSQFYIILNPGGLAYLDGNHVVFGIILDGMGIVDKMEKIPTTKERPDQRITIVDSGQLQAPIAQR